MPGDSRNYTVWHDSYQIYHITLQVVEMARGKFENTEGIQLGGYLNHPHSIGTIRLRSSKPSDTLVIDAHFLEDPIDVKVMIESG